MHDDLSPVFEIFYLTHGWLAEDAAAGTSLVAWTGGSLSLDAGATHFGFVASGRATIRAASGEFTLGEGMYFSIPHEGQVEGAGSSGIVVSQAGYTGVFLLGGPIEARGRLRYIDGCTDSLLVPPVLLGDPCLNALYFPPGIDQTPHTHPSHRIGVVARGRGECILPDRTVPLEAGRAFLIPAEQLHSFRTQDDAMVVIAYHPDSDFGPTHERHPMINRTIVDGVPAFALDAIRTGETP